MRFVANAETDIGTTKETNQDSLLIKQASSDKGEILMAVVCDGMGGLAKGELASATVVRRFSEWFEKELPYELEHFDMQIVASKWELLLKDLNTKILAYGRNSDINLGTTFSGILFVGNQFLVVHVGDSRIYQISEKLRQLTSDHTFVAREVSRGAMTLEEAKTDKRRNMLLQCIGASKVIEPEIILGTTDKGVYMLCSDGFRHEVTEEEICHELKPDNLRSKNAMHDKSRYLIDLVKSRKEKDNISVIIIRVD